MSEINGFLSYILDHGDQYECGRVFHNADIHYVFVIRGYSGFTLCQDRDSRLMIMAGLMLPPFPERPVVNTECDLLRLYRLFKIDALVFEGI
jgi:hypothetical protein